MRRVILALLCSGLASPLSAAFAVSASAAEEAATERRVVRLVGAADLYPIMDAAPDGAPSGYGFRIAEAILRRAGFEAVPSSDSWPRTQRAAFEEGAVVAGFSHTPERRAEGWLFSPVAFRVPVRLVAAADGGPRSAAPADLAGMSVAVPAGGGFGGSVREALAGAVVVEAPHEAARLRLVLGGRVDAALLSDPERALARARSLHGLDVARLRLLPGPALQNELHLSTGPGTPGAEALIEAIDRAIADLEREGVIRAMVEEAGPDG